MCRRGVSVGAEVLKRSVPAIRAGGEVCLQAHLQNYLQMHIPYSSFHMLATLC